MVIPPSERLNYTTVGDYLFYANIEDYPVVDFLLWGTGRTKQIGYSCDYDHRNQGYCTEALLHLLPFIPLGYRRLIIYKTKAASLRVAEKCGFVLVGYDYGSLIWELQ
jgi:RimJ/RimL family protein N-acetyltransferase